VKARLTPEVTIDWTKCFGYEVLIEEEIELYSALEVTEDLKEGGIAANRAWNHWYEYLAATWRTDFGSEIVEAASRAAEPRLLSLGCGYGGMEIAGWKEGRTRSWRWTSMRTFSAARAKRSLATGSTWSSRRSISISSSSSRTPMT
jgi:hypothetical protein